MFILLCEVDEIKSFILNLIFKLSTNFPQNKLFNIPTKKWSFTQKNRFHNIFLYNFNQFSIPLLLFKGCLLIQSHNYWRRQFSPNLRRIIITSYIKVKIHNSSNIIKSKEFLRFFLIWIRSDISIISSN